MGGRGRTASGLPGPGRPLPAPVTEAIAELWTDTHRIDAIVSAGRRLELESSAERLWRLAETGRPPAPATLVEPAEADLRETYLHTLEQTQRSDPMPRTAAFLRRALLDWYAT